MNGRVFSSPVAGFSMTHMSGLKCSMISRALSTSASPSLSRQGRIVRARLYSVQTGPDHVKVPRRKQRVVPAPDVAQDRGLKFRHDVQGNNLPPCRLEGSANRLCAAKQLQQSRHVFNNYHQHNKARTGKGAAQAVSHAWTNLFLIGDRKG